MSERVSRAKAGDGVTRAMGSSLAFPIPVSFCGTEWGRADRARHRDPAREQRTPHEQTCRTAS